MKRYDYLIVGGGMAGDAAIGGIRAVDKSGMIAIISDERFLPYKRPPLSKGLWKQEPMEEAFLRRDFQALNVDYYLTTRIKEIDANQKQLVSADGLIFGYDKLLLATGGKPRRLAWDTNQDVLYYRTMDDYVSLKQQLKTNSRVAIVGGGFIGAEMAQALAGKERTITMVFPEPHLMSHVFPEGLSLFLEQYYRERGVVMHSGDEVIALEKKSGKYILTTRQGRLVEADIVLGGIGLELETTLAEGAGIQVNRGIVVDDRLMTSAESIYAAGDVAEFYSPALAQHIQVEHEDNSVVQGRMAGMNMAGRNKEYHHLPFFYSDMFDLGYEAIGLVRSQFEMVEDWVDLYRRGVVYYRQDGKIVGVLNWNVWDRIDQAEELIARKETIAIESLKGLIRD